MLFDTINSATRNLAVNGPVNLTCSRQRCVHVSVLAEAQGTALARKFSGTVQSAASATSGNRRLLSGNAKYSPLPASPHHSLNFCQENNAN